jgi:predicted house-cleaning NTP pyrophosphatase (Maf/HAM1 superfamily)
MYIYGLITVSDHSYIYILAMAEQISLSDCYVLLHDEVVNENRELRKKLEEIHKKDEATMKTLSERVDVVSAKVVSAPSRVRQTGSRRIRVPRLSSVSIRSY